MEKLVKGKILIVDDDIHALQAFERILKNASYEVFIAKNGEEALNKINSEKLHLVLLDVVLPDISGLEVLKKIKANQTTSSIFVVLISGSLKSPEDQSEGLELGADGFILKPIQNREFLARVEAFMRHKNTIDQLKESEEKFRTIFNSTNDAIFIYDDENDKILDINDAMIEIYGYQSKEEISNLYFSDLSAENSLKTKQILEEIFTNALRGEAQKFEWHAKKKNGNTFWVEVSLKLVEVYDTKKVLAVVREITEQKNAEKKLIELNTELEQKVIQRTNEIDIQLQKLNKSQKAMLYMIEDLNLVSVELKEERKKLEISNKELEAFSYSVSHDLRAPLRHITGFIKLFLEKKSTQLSSEEQDILNTVSISADDMGKLIDALLSFSKLNRAALQKTSFNSLQVIEQLLVFYNQEIEARSIEMTIKNLPNAYGDPQLIAQVWTNLISNAIKYTSKKEKAIIEIGGYIENGETIFYIKDNGAGFDMKYVDKLFGVFQRLHKVRDFEGIGIGLANINRIVKRHDGCCWAEGEIDKGAVFYFSLPKEAH